MKKAWDFFKEYYLIYLIIFSVLIVIFSLSNDSINFYEGVFFGIVLFIPMTIILGTLEYISDKYYKPWKVKKLLNNKPLIEFKNIGFINDEDGGLKGKYRNYYLYVGVNWINGMKRPYFYYQVLFNPLSNDRFLREEEYNIYWDKLIKKDIVFNLNTVLKIIDKGHWFSKKNKYIRVIKDIDFMIDFLKTRKLEPINFKEWEVLIPEIEKHAEGFVN